MPPIGYAFGAMIAFMMLCTLHKLADRLRCRPQQVNLPLFAWCTLFSFTPLAIRSDSLSISRCGA